MKWLSGGLTFVNFATICGLFIGILTGGLSTAVALAALVLAVGFALLAYLRTTDPGSQADAPNPDKSKTSKYRNLPIWILAGLGWLARFRGHVLDLLSLGRRLCGRGFSFQWRSRGL